MTRIGAATKALVALSLAGLVLIGCAGCSRGIRWVSRATFTVRNAAAGGTDLAGTYTAADSTVPAGSDGNAELDPEGATSPGTVLFEVIIGDNPGESAPNLYQFTLNLPAYHGVGSYTLVSGQSGATFDVTVTARFSQEQNIWSLGRSKVATCAVAVTADVAMKDPTIRRLRGGITCGGLYDDRRLTSTATLNGHFDVFAEVWCTGDQPMRPCRTPPPE